MVIGELDLESFTLDKTNQVYALPIFTVNPVKFQIGLSFKKLDREAPACLQHVTSRRYFLPVR
jgi:hypothetical protein